MKIAISGKGGVGKTTLAGAMALYLAESGQRVLAIDADPDSNLPSALGVDAARAAAYAHWPRSRNWSPSAPAPSPAPSAACSN